MNIILGEENVKDIDNKYIVLELDTMVIDGAPVKAYCLVEQMSLDEFFTLDNYRDLHEKLISNYHKKNWSFCEQAIEHLKGRWRGEVDSFYDSLLERVVAFKDNDPGTDWNGFIVKN